MQNQGLGKSSIAKKGVLFIITRAMPSIWFGLFRTLKQFYSVVNVNIITGDEIGTLNFSILSLIP